MTFLQKYGVLAASVLLALIVGAAGIAKLMGVPMVHQSFAILGLPSWFGYFIGAAEVAGAVGLFIPALSRLAAAGLAIIGAGAVGILFLPLLSDIGAQSIVFDMRPERLALAKQWGAIDGCVVNSGDIVDIAKRHSEGRGVDLVILSVVTKATLETALQTIRDGGTILLFGSKPNNSFAIDWWEIWRREINLTTSYSATPELMPRAMASLAKPNYAFEKLVSHNFKLAEAQQAFDLVHEGKASKIVLTNE